MCVAKLIWGPDIDIFFLGRVVGRNIHVVTEKKIYLNLDRVTEGGTDIQFDGRRGTDTSRLRDRPGQIEKDNRQRETI